MNRHALVVSLIALTAGAVPAGAADIKVMSSNGIRSVLVEALPDFERSSGHKVAVSYDTANLLVSRIKAGESGDLAIMTGPAMDELVKLGRVVPGGRVELARSGVGVGVRAGLPKPNVATVEAFKQALLDAKSVAYTTTGASGIYFSGLIERLGIAAQVKAKARTPAGGSVSEMVAKGEADMAVQQIPEILAVKGVQFAGPLPRELQSFTAYPAAVFADAKQPAAAASLVKFLSTPAVARVIQAKGMEPAGPQ